MDISLASQLESPLLNSLASSLDSKPFNYKLEKNYPMLSKHNVKVQPVVTPSGSVYNSSLVVKAPRYGLNYGCAAKVKVLGTATPTASLTRTSTIGSRFFKNSSFRSHNRIIQDNWAEYVESRINNAPSEQNNAYLNMTTPSPALANTVTSTFYVPLFFFFGEHFKNALDTSFVEPLEVHFNVNDRTGMWGSDELLFDMSFVSVELEFWYINLENSVHSALVASQFPLSNNLTILSNDSYKETPVNVTHTEASDGTSKDITLEMKSNSVITASHFICRDKDANALLPISSIVLTSSGQTLVDSERKTQVYENSRLDSFIHNVVGSSSGSEMYSIFYGMDSDKTYISGALAAGGLNAPIFTVTVDTTSLTANTALELVCVHDTATLLTVNSSDGSIMRSLAN